MKSFMQEKETKIGGGGECRKEEEIEDRKERRGKRKGRRVEEQGPISNTSFSLECGPITREFIRMPNSLSGHCIHWLFQRSGPSSPTGFTSAQL